MVALRGTPIVAVRDGAVEFTTGRLGGNAVWLVASDGDRFYDAHLDTFQGSSRFVAGGEVIGYVGRSGNAGNDHLHFELHDGATCVNPYPAVRAARGTLGDFQPVDAELAPSRARR
jgi:murein DD-endopeptidase MepM/ murein hydrolase activator NlpD